MSIVVEYGSNIPDVAWEVQDKVKTEIETMTGINVESVNVSVDGINVPADGLKQDTAVEKNESDEATEE